MISCVIINFNGKKYLKSCLDSLLAADFPDEEIIMLDNASSDGSAEHVMEYFPRVRFVVNRENLGYAAAANQGIRLTQAPLVMVMNPDVVLEPDYLKILAARLKQDAKIGAIGGKLKQFDFERGKKTDVVDSTGLWMMKNRRCVDRGQGERDRGQYDRAEEVFGITGACPLYRRTALEDCKIGGEYFDESFFMYKEDVDLSWRMRLFGWKCFYESGAVAWHGRGTAAVERRTLAQMARGRNSLPRFIKVLSYRNERLMRVKNDFWSLMARHAPWILAKEAAVFLWAAFREPYLLKALAQFLFRLPSAFKKRRAIMRRVKVKPREMARWFLETGV